MPLFQNKEEIKRIIEAILFISEKPISKNFFSSFFNISEREIESIFDELMSEYKLRESGILIIETDASYHMVTNPKYFEWISLFKNITLNHKISEQALETLAIVAYKQPITKAEIEKIRGVNSDYALKTLIEKKLIKIVGKKEIPGRPFLYGTTKEFLKLFGITNLKELPKLEEFQKINVA